MSPHFKTDWDFGLDPNEQLNHKIELPSTTRDGFAVILTFSDPAVEIAPAVYCVATAEENRSTGELTPLSIQPITGARPYFCESAVDADSLASKVNDLLPSAYVIIVGITVDKMLVETVTLFQLEED